MAGYGGQQQYNGGPSTPKAHQRRGMEKDPEEALEMELTPPKSPSRSPFKSPWNRPLGNKNNDSRKPNPFGTIGEKSNRPSAAAGAGRIPPNKTKTSPKDFNYSVLKPGKVSYIGKGPPRAGSVRNPRSRFFPEDTKSRRALALEQLFRGFNEPISSETLEDEDRVPHSPVDLPPEFKQRLEREKIWGRGFNDDIVRYYTEDMSKYDSRSIPGRGGNPSLLEDILKAGAEDRLKGTEGPGWRPVRYVGKGGQGLVTLWEHKNEQNEVREIYF
ncbi:MAG: hypothetical protein M1812_006947 [Candelaria pacifica]|nr:MAG: hypothetical protein M1812_006947 [Candelaria pacifica]